MKPAIVRIQYDSIEEVTVRLPKPVDESEPEPSHPHSINIDEPAPKSYVCLGYTFSIIAGFCFTSWSVLGVITLGLDRLFLFTAMLGSSLLG